MVAVGVFAAAASASPLKVPLAYKNCTAVNAKYPHGIGKAGARDHVSSGTPVTTFRRSTKLYNLAMSINRGLDRDGDGVACERD